MIQDIICTGETEPFHTQIKPDHLPADSRGLLRSQSSAEEDPAAGVLDYTCPGGEN